MNLREKLIKLASERDRLESHLATTIKGGRQMKPRKSWEIRETHERLDLQGWPHRDDEFDRAEAEALNREWMQTVLIKWPLCLGWNYPNKWN